MKSNNIVVGFALAVSAFSALAEEGAPVLDINQTTSVETNTVNPSNDVATLQRALQVRNRALNDMQQQINELQTEVSQLRGTTEEQAYTIQQILQRQRELYQDIERRLSAANTTPVATNSNESVNYSSNLSENQLYDRAVNLVLKERKYELAIAEFKSFNQKYPNSSYSANAHYWLGQLLFNKGDLSGAETEFSNVIDNYEDSTKRPDAMLKLGMVAQKQNNNAKAKSIYTKLISEYTGSSAAKLAETRLSSL
ncbi:tol-pal system protein YbgF [Thalassotalea crassostreae]|uniref:tol-pal system protein YbgF n=1 Tax=Thalassotalea crassostreae TaxID=1763536 RepID=UPI0008397EA4|nr:tol-pal system protein YbgF [Thalassotalea crassostreae]